MIALAQSAPSKRGSIENSPVLVEAVATAVSLRREGRFDMDLKEFHTYLTTKGAPASDGTRVKARVGYRALGYYIERAHGFSWTANGGS